jgi:hypothetical protein
MNSKYGVIGLGGLIFLVVIFVGLYFFPWSKVNQPATTLTVVGEAETKERNQLAEFSATLEATHENKEEAVNEVTRMVETLTRELNNFGIKGEDLRSSYSSVNQGRQDYNDPSSPLVWTARTVVDVTLRDPKRVGELKRLLLKNGAIDIQGPTFSLEDTSSIQKSLLGQAIQDARQKAEIIAQASNHRLGKIVSLSEGYPATGQFIYSGYGGGVGGGGDETLAGTAEITAAVTVVFELR